MFRTLLWSLCPLWCNRGLSSVAVTLAAILLVACAPRAEAPAGPPLPNPDEVEAELVRETTPDAPRRVDFSWSLEEPELRVRGQGVVRMEAPDRLRLDLFGARGDTYLQAALVGDEFRVPAAVEGRFPLPEPTLLWGALGVVRPPTEAPADAHATDVGVRLGYDLSNGDIMVIRVRSAGDGTRVETVERSRAGRVVETVERSGTSEGDLGRARYRNVAEARVLTLDFETVEDASAFPAEIWSPGGAR